MAVRTPLYMAPPVAVEPYKQLNPFDTTMMSQLHELAGYAFATNPNPRIEINGSNGSAVEGQPFTDTWWSSGAYTTRVDRFSTEAETPNTFQVTDNYSRIRVVYDSVSLPTGDTNNTQYPLYLWDSDGSGDNMALRSMSVTDFIDTFVLPVIDQFGGGGQSMAKGGTYYLTTTATPPNATLVSATPAAVNNQANVAGYSASAIPTVNNITTNYYVAKVDYSPTTNGLWDEGAVYDLPLYFDAGTESIRHHSPASWAALLNPFLRFYLGGGSAEHTLRYSVDGVDGITNGSVYVDTGIVSSGSVYNTRFVNANDYRTQEFPSGTAVVISQKAFKIYQGIPTLTETVSLEGTSLSPHSSGVPPLSDGSLTAGWRFSTDGNVEDYNADIGYTASGHANWNNVTPTGTWYIRANLQTRSSGSIAVPDVGGLAMNTWHDVTAGNKTFTFFDGRAMNSYGEAEVTLKIEISRNNNGTNIAATGYYRYIWEGGA